jgi:hypothetical protein
MKCRQRAVQFAEPFPFGAFSFAVPHKRLAFGSWELILFNHHGFLTNDLIITVAFHSDLRVNCLD